MKTIETTEKSLTAARAVVRIEDAGESCMGVFASMQEAVEWIQSPEVGDLLEAIKTRGVDPSYGFEIEPIDRGFALCRLGDFAAAVDTAAVEAADEDDFAAFAVFAVLPGARALGYIVAAKESGDEINCSASYSEAEEKILRYEEDDRREYEAAVAVAVEPPEGFYSVVPVTEETRIFGVPGFQNIRRITADIKPDLEKPVAVPALKRDAKVGDLKEWAIDTARALAEQAMGCRDMRLDRAAIRMFVNTRAVLTSILFQSDTAGTNEIDIYFQFGEEA